MYEALKQKDNAMILRYLSIDLYEEYEREELILQLKERISDISIYDCTYDNYLGVKVIR